MTSITPDGCKLGFIGIGSMGRPIARRLLESGYNLTAYNRDRSKAEALVGHGAVVANSIAEIASNWGCSVKLDLIAASRPSSRRSNDLDNPAISQL